jgi:hypothetical protein
MTESIRSPLSAMDVRMPGLITATEIADATSSERSFPFRSFFESFQLIA